MIQFLRRSIIIGAVCLTATATSANTDFGTAVRMARNGAYADAAAAFSRLAQTGHIAAQANLAVIYARGEGVVQNDSEAAYWAWRARLSGELRAIDLCVHLHNQLSPDARDIVAKRLNQHFESRAQNGDHAALLALGRVELEVRQAPAPEAAVIWFMLAAAFEVEHATRLRDVHAQDLEDAQRESAQRKAIDLFIARCETLAEGDRVPTCPST